MSGFNKAHFLSHESNLLMMSTAGPLVHSQYHQRQRLRPLHKCGETNFRKNISSPFGRPDVTRPKITTHARTHTSAHKQVPPPGGFLVLNRLACWDTAWCVRGGKKKTSRVFAAARHSNRTRCAAFAASVALVITAASAGDGTSQRVYACMCVRVSRTAVPSGGIFELFYLLRGCCAFPGEVGRSRVQTCAAV